MTTDPQHGRADRPLRAVAPDPARSARDDARAAIRVALSSDDELTEAGLREHLRVERWTTVVEACDDPEIVLVAVRDLGAAAIDRLRGLAERPGLPIVLVTTASVDQWREGELLTVVEYGVRAVLDRTDATAERLLRTVVTVRDGGGDLPVGVQGQLMRDVARLQREVLAPHGLSASGLADRELDVLRLLADGLELKEIAAQLGFSERTVKNVLYSMLQRLGLRNRVQAVSYALRAGLI